MPDIPALRLKRDDVWCFTWRNCIHLCWYEVTADALRATATLASELSLRHARGIVTVSSLLAGAPAPCAEARELAAQLTGEQRGKVKATAAVVEGQSLAQSPARALLSDLTLAGSRAGIRHKVFASLEKVAPWLAVFMFPDPTPDRVEDLEGALVRARGTLERELTPLPLRAVR